MTERLAEKKSPVEADNAEASRTALAEWIEPTQRTSHAEAFMESRPSDQAGVEIFDSALDPEASLKFSRWRQGNKILGHYLNESPNYGWVLHRARCNHVSMPAGSDLARNEKICGSSREVVQQYAIEKGIKYHRCQTCRPR
jgi:hypothetical protein